ncbi:glutathione S-transferase 1-like [Patella vulgata]|uniref:glutathione S-transferase 1-like n=1 Tax=Patella vulgata TaxID=6465 RepID=UPI0024A96BCD|nr:glutathione S-transferase 1-like [Patella vulgata]
MPAFRLHYFDSRGRAEIARLMFNAAGQEFDDVRYSKEEWPAFKPKTPLGQLPVLEVDGKLYAESGAIFNYLARELDILEPFPLLRANRKTVESNSRLAAYLKTRK